MLATIGKRPRGRKQMPAWLRAHYHHQAFKRHGHRVKHLPRATQSIYMCATDPKWYLLPTDDQGQCGDCFGVSMTDLCSMAIIAAGGLPRSPDSRLSSQAGLDCGWFQGGCNGGDEAQVADYIKSTGAPLTSAYGPYVANPGQCKTGLALYKIADWGFCTPSQQSGVANTDDMKACMLAYGPISIAIDAGEFDNYSGGTITGGGTSVDHAIACIGWDDTHDNGDGSKGAWVVWNQWGQWGITINGVTGCAWVKYGADSCGTESIFLSGGALPPPPTPPSFVAPFFLFEGSMSTPKPVGDTAGYPDVTTANGAAQVIANADNTGVMVHDSTGAMVDIVPPLPPVPPTPPPPPTLSATVTIPDQTIQVGGLFHQVITIKGGTYPVVFSQSREALPPWVLQLIMDELRLLCTEANNLPAPWNTWANIACGLIPATEGHKALFSVGLTIPTWLLPLLRNLCQYSGLLPAPYNLYVTIACGLIPPATMKSIQATPCGCH